MSKSTLSVRLLALFLMFACPVFVQAQTLADRIPADALIYVGWAGIESPVPGFRGSHLQEVLNDSNLPQVFDDFIPKVLDRISKQDKQTAEGIKVFRALAGPMWRHPSAFAFMGVDANNANGPWPKIILLSKAGKESASLKKEVGELLKQAGQIPFQVSIIQIKDIVAIVVGYDKPETAIPDGGADSKSLATDANFIKALAQAGKDPAMTAYVDFEAVLKLADMAAGFADADIQKKWAKAKDTLALSGIKRLIATQGFDEKEWGTQAFIDAPAPRTGLAAMLEGDQLSEEMLKAIPKNATLAGATHFDIAGLIQTLRTGVVAFDADAAKQIDQAFDQVNQTVGLDVEKDFLATLGDEWGYYTDPAMAGNGFTGVTVINRLKDPAKAEAALVKLETFINQFIVEQLKKEPDAPIIAFRQARMGNTQVHFLGFPLIAPAWAVQDGNLYIGLYPEVVAAAAAQVADKGESVLDNPDFMSLYHRLGEHAASSFSYADVARLAPNTYPIWFVVSHIAGAGDLFGVPAPLIILPPLKKLLPHLSPIAQIAWTEADGLHFRGIEPFPGSSLLASDPSSMTTGQAAMAVSILLPALNKARSQAQQVKSASNLKNIGLAAQMYANNQKDGSFPKDLATLSKEEDLVPEVFIDPRGDHKVPFGLTPAQATAWIMENSDYVWNGAGKKNSTAPDAILAWEKSAGPNSRGINFLFVDGHVEFVESARAAEMIQKAMEKPKAE